MFRLVLLNTIGKSLQIKKEGVYAARRNWFSDGYRAAAPGLHKCSQDTDCEAGEICQAGYCYGLHRRTDIHNLHYGDEYRTLIQRQSNNPLHFIPDRDIINGSYFYINQPVFDIEEEVIDYEYNYDYS